MVAPNIFNTIIMIPPSPTQKLCIVSCAPIRKH